MEKKPSFKRPKGAVSPLEILYETEAAVESAWVEGYYHRIVNKEAVSEVAPSYNRNLYGGSPLDLFSELDPDLSRKLLDQKAVKACLVGAARLSRLILNGIKPNTRAISADRSFQLAMGALGWAITGKPCWWEDDPYRPNSFSFDGDFEFRMRVSKRHAIHGYTRTVNRLNAEDVITSYNDTHSKASVLKVLDKAITALQQRRYKEVYGYGRMPW